MRAPLPVTPSSRCPPCLIACFFRELGDLWVFWQLRSFQVGLRPLDPGELAVGIQDGVLVGLARAERVS